MKSVMILKIMNNVERFVQFTKSNVSIVKTVSSGDTPHCLSGNNFLFGL